MRIFLSLLSAFFLSSCSVNVYHHDKNYSKKPACENVQIESVFSDCNKCVDEKSCKDCKRSKK